MRDPLTLPAKIPGLCIFVTLCFGFQSAGAEDLVPSKPGTAPNYWCTWGVQNDMFRASAKARDLKEREGPTGAEHARGEMSEEHVFGMNGWATTFFPRVRGDLYFMYDDGLFRDGMGSFQIDEKKFPFLAGLDAQERILKLNERTRAAGWRGAALWCRDPVTNGEASSNLVRWSKYGGVEFWKIDGGDHNFAFIDIAKILYPALKMEHVHPRGPFNGDWKHGGIGRFGAYQTNSHEAQCLEHTDVFRTYDVTSALALPTTLDRVAEALRYGDTHAVRALINVEEEVYLAATLGCTMGVMRHPPLGHDAGMDVSSPHLRQCQCRLDEVVRALHWQRLAPPFVHFAADRRQEDATRIDEHVLADSWDYKRGDTWMPEATGKTIRQGAPARVSRGLPLPKVTSEGEPPFVIVGRFPNGAVAVAVQGRTAPDKNWTFPPADVTLDVGATRGPIGVFGQYRNLILVFAAPLGKVRILAQDLAGAQAEDITGKVTIKDATLMLPGSLIKRVGLSAATKGDISDPGLMLVIRED